MSSERKPTAESSILSRPIVAITRFCVRYPASVVVVSVAVSLLCVIAAVGNLGFKTRRVDLIDPNSGFNRLWLEYVEEFGDDDDLILVVEGENSTEVASVLDELSNKISSQKHLFTSVLNGINTNKIRAKGLHYLPLEDLENVNRFTKDAGDIVRGQWSRLNIGNSLDILQFRLTRPGDVLRQSGLALSGITEEQFRQSSLFELDLLSQSLVQAFAPKPSYSSPWPAFQGYPGMPEVVTACSQSDNGYFIIPGKDGDNAMGFVLVQIAQSDHNALAYGTEAIQKLRELIAETHLNHPDMKIGLTGIPVMENDEMSNSQAEMNKASLLALVGVCCVFVAGIGGFRHPMLAVFTLIISFGWTAGYILFAVGHLNILSIAFGAILIGLGTDFSVHYISRYMQLRQTVRSPSEAIVQTAMTVGPGVFTGAITTAVAFFMASFTDFTGIIELGIISGGGILLCCVGTLILIPAFIQLTDGKRPMRHIPQPLDVYPWFKPLFSNPKLTIGIAVAVSAFLFLGLPKVWYDHNLLNLQPQGLESVELERKLLESGGQNAWYAISIADSREELLRRKDEFAKKYPELQVTEIVSMLPPINESKQNRIASIAQTLDGMPERPPIIPLSQPEKIGQSVAQLQMLLGSDQLSQQISRNLNQVRQYLRGMSEAECFKRMQDYQNAVAGDLLSRLHILRDMTDLNPPQMSDLPEQFVSRFHSKSGKHLMRIYSSADIWNMNEMENFVHSVRDIDPKATGSPLQTYEASLQMQKGYQNAAIYAFFAIVYLLFFDFRNVKDTLLALVPMLIGMGQAFGVMGYLGIPLNPANMIAIPLILGIGIDDGIHIMHDYRLQKGTYRMSSSTANSVLITSLTTFIGFGSLMISSHQGLQSLGRVLVIGITCCMFCSLVLLPAFLMVWTKNHDTATEERTNEVFETKTNGYTAPNSTGAAFDEIEIPCDRSDVPTEVFPLYSQQDEQETGTMGTKTKRLKRRNVA